MLVLGNVKVQEVSFRSKAASDSRVPCFITGMETAEEEKEGDLNMMANRLVVKKNQRVTMDESEGIMNLSDTPMDMVSTPIRPASGWVNAPADALECTMLLAQGLYPPPLPYFEKRAGHLRQFCYL